MLNLGPRGADLYIKRLVHRFPNKYLETFDRTGPAQ